MEFNALLAERGKGTAHHHFHGERLLTRIARFLPEVLEVAAEPASVQQE
jgi:hypothetical protein